MREPTDEQKVIMGMARQALKIAVTEASFRHIFCWDGEAADSGYDCAACIGWMDCSEDGCKCVCHNRISELDRLFLAALLAMHEKQNSWWWDRDVDGKKKEEGK